eukprot:CAMPEP_0201645810 /NCGR_PEP_ID=MMETSP0493-20130528/32813_1 /ASSEMBLY_ACC=CAM_ASM_000838 /TAXON_ID=420259 /ORGANISM="Thalassiosira gravida, Strain GMp14c1" /LENGTH=196 /DNA_ID=CAMNT_0048120833 /DNA_START=470 /DNA_END=1057 /DNA_ORIENTATION=+
MADTTPFYCDDISSIDSSSCRERRYSDECDRVSKQKLVINSLTYAVQRLADTLRTKEVELETKEAKLEVKAVELKMKDRAEVDLECKMLDQLIEIQKLKNRVTDLTEGRASSLTQDTPISQQWNKDHMTRETSDDFSSFQRDAFTRGHHDDKENCDNGAVEEENGEVENLKAIQVGKTLPRRSSGRTSKIMPKKYP